MDQILAIAFWLSSTALGYTFVGYPMLIHWLGKRRQRPRVDSSGTGSADQPTASIVLVVRNEATRICGRIANLLDTDYPPDRLELVIISDGSTDDTARLVGDAKNASVRLLDHQSHRGKPACLNDAVAAATGELVVFADARQRFTRSTIPALVAGFVNPLVGAVSGELQIERSSGGAGAGVDAYWRLEKAIRLGESRIDSSIGCTGAVYAIRRAAFQPLPPDTILDDVVCPMLIALAGQRVLFCPEAVAFDPQALSPESEKRRKRRTLAGNFQMLFRYPSWLLPWRNRLVIQLISHKYLRLAAPLLMFAALLSSLVLAVHGSLFFLCVTLAQGFFYLLALTGIAVPSLAWRGVTLPAGFVFLNGMTLLGLIEYFKLRGRTGW